MRNSQNVIAFAVAGGLGLPDRDYYTKTDEKSVDIRNKYLVHVQAIFELLGDKPDIAKAEAAKVMEIETALARATLTRVGRRDPYKSFHKVDFNGLQAMTPHFDWSIYIKGLGLPAQKAFNVTEPAFGHELDKQLTTLDLKDIKSYLRCHVAHARAPSLSGVRERGLRLFHKYAAGGPQLRPRWKRCVSRSTINSARRSASNLWLAHSALS